MIAILTKYHGPTNTRGSRISARRGDSYPGDGHPEGRISIPYPHELSGEDCHRAAADALCARFGWTGRLVGGGTRDGYAFCFVPEDRP